MDHEQRDTFEGITNRFSKNPACRYKTSQLGRPIQSYVMERTPASCAVFPGATPGFRVTSIDLLQVWLFIQVIILTNSYNPKTKVAITVDVETKEKSLYSVHAKTLLSTLILTSAHTLESPLFSHPPSSPYSKAIKTHIPGGNRQNKTIS